MRTVAEKDQGQLDLQALHRVRARLVSRRTATINQIRAFLIEQGITVRSGLRALKNSFEAILDQRREEISRRMRGILMGLYGDWLWLDRRIEDVTTEIEEISRTEEMAFARAVCGSAANFRTPTPSRVHRLERCRTRGGCRHG